MKLTIVIPCYNNWSYTKYCLNNFKQLKNEYELVIVDNASSDGTEEGIKEFINPNLIYIRNNENLGFGAAVNLGFNKSSGKSVMFLNNDIKISDKSFQWLDRFSTFILCQDQPMLVGPTGGLVDNNFNFVYETSDAKKKINYMSAWCLTATRETWNSLILPNQLGPFDSASFFAYFEDTDLGFRARELNILFNIYSLPIIHLGKQTSKLMNTQKLYLDSKSKFFSKWKSSKIKNNN